MSREGGPDLLPKTELGYLALADFDGSWRARALRRNDRTMKRSRFTEEQISGILRGQKAGVSIADVCWKHGISRGLAAPGGGLRGRLTELAMNSADSAIAARTSSCALSTTGEPQKDPTSLP
jgi:hypothetical protein